MAANATVALQEWRFREPSILPGFGLTLGFSMAYLSFIVLIPLGVLVVRALGVPLEQMLQMLTDPRVLASLRLSFGASFLAALINACLGLTLAWSLTRYEFPGRRLLDALVDLPFALPTAVSGIALVTLFAPSGWLGRWLEPLGIQVAYTWIGVTVALTLIGLPFVVRTVQPALARDRCGSGGRRRIARRIAVVCLPARRAADDPAGARDRLCARAGARGG